MKLKDFVGQEEVISYIWRAISKKEISHAYIIEGSKGVGKKELAISFAKGIFCENFTDDFCDECINCNRIKSLNHPDVHIIEPEKGKNIRVEAIEKIIEQINKKSFEGGNKVFIICESEKMRIEAANKLLKTLEEPVGNVVFMLLTDNKDMLLSTIVSRCQVLKFKDVKYNEIVDFLVEKYRVDNDKASIIAGYSNCVINNAIDIVSGKNKILSFRDEIIEKYDRIINGNRSLLGEYEDYFDKDKMEDVVLILTLWNNDILNKIYKNDALIVNRDKLLLIASHSEKMNIKKIVFLNNYMQRMLKDIKANVNYKLIVDNFIISLQEEII